MEFLFGKISYEKHRCYVNLANPAELLPGLHANVSLLQSSVANTELQQLKSGTGLHS